MISLIPIQLTGADIRTAVVPGIQEESRRERFINDENLVDCEEKKFRFALLTGSARTLTAAPFVPEIHKDMEWLYNQRLVKSSLGRPIWERILKLGGEKCPLCHISIAKTLDHSIPKSVHPRLAVEPQNLVPACRDCNLERHVGRRNMSLSPYVDSWAVDLPWLFASVLDPAHPEDLTFSPQRHKDFSDEQWEILTEFFIDTDMGNRYANLAIDEFFPLRAGLHLFNRGPIAIDEVEPVLAERHFAYSSELGENRWQTAAYAAWIQAVRIIDW